MNKWDMRTHEVAYLLNPAFCGRILYSTIKTYNEILNRAFPFPLIYLVLPLVLHKQTRINICITERVHTMISKMHKRIFTVFFTKFMLPQLLCFLFQLFLGHFYGIIVLPCLSIPQKSTAFCGAFLFMLLPPAAGRPQILRCRSTMWYTCCGTGCLTSSHG